MARLAETRKLPNMFAFEHAWNVYYRLVGIQELLLPQGLNFACIGMLPATELPSRHAVTYLS